MAVTVIGLGLASAVGLYVAVQNKKSLPPVAQALMGGRLVHITTQGMYPTLKSGDTVAFDSRAYLDHAPQRGDIVLFVAPGSGGHIFIKRVIAIPLDRLRITNGVVLVNGRQLSEPYVTEPWTLDTSWPSTGQENTIPPNDYFVMGDNRDHSSDSRTLGYVSRKDILGKLIR